MALASPPVGNGTGRGVREWFGGLPDRYVYGGGALVFLMLAWIGTTIWGSELDFPERFTFGKALASRVDEIIRWVTVNMAFILDPLSDGILWFLVKLEDFFQWLPWPVTITAITAIAYKVAGRRMGIFAMVTLLLLGGFGLWQSAMETMALIAVSVMVSIAIALPVGILAARSDVVDALIRPILDAMQTMPAFVYLVPAIMFFGIGNPAAVLATVIYAVPPAIRLTNLGIRQVSPTQQVKVAVGL